MIRTTAAFALTALLGTAGYTRAGTTFRFDVDPFEGTTARTTPGRQVVGGELFIPGFAVGEDVFSFDPAVFGVDDEVRFFSGKAADLPAGGVNVIVLQDVDPDGDPTTPFGASNAADLIASTVTEAGAGFFVYHNSALGLNRLVYSTDLSQGGSNTDLKILARLTDPSGQAAIDALPTFTARDFAIQAIPEPSTFALAALGGVCLLAHGRRRLKRA